MKIYHTETQADYDALMVELEEQGCKWSTGGKMTKLTKNWKRNSSETCVRVDKKVVMYDEKSYYAWKYPEVPIQKYKSKADEKMRFTKENVYKLTERYNVDENYFMDDFKSDIFNLDDTPKKAIVPKCFDEWYKEIEVEYPIPDNNKTFALWKLCQQGFGRSFEDIRGKKIPYETDLGEWLFENKMLAIDAVLNGYTIEPEQLYYIPLPDLETSDGLQQVLSKRENGMNYFASRPNEKLKQRYTKAELERVPEVYKPYAKPIEEESE